MIRCRESCNSEQQKVVFTEEDRVNHGGTTSRNEQTSHSRRSCATEVDEQPPQQRLLSEHANDARATWEFSELRMMFLTSTTSAVCFQHESVETLTVNGQASVDTLVLTRIAYITTVTGSWQEQNRYAVTKTQGAFQFRSLMKQNCNFLKIFN